jgi:hypothetical protein
MWGFYLFTLLLLLHPPIPIPIPIVSQAQQKIHSSLPVQEEQMKERKQERELKVVIPHSS